jgi:hypothetical protein
MSSAKVEAVQRLVRESVQAVDALSPVALRAVLPALRAVRDELQADVRGWLGSADYRDRFTALQRTGMLRALEGTFDRVRELDPAMAGALAAGRHATGPLAIHNLDTEITRLSAIFGNGMPTLPNIKTAAVLAQGDKLLWRRHESSAKRYAGQVGDDIKHLLAVGVAKHESIEQLVARLRKLGPGPRVAGGDPGADAARIAEGMFARHRWWADRLVRTEVMHSYAIIHDIATEHANENRPDGEPEYVRRWDASMDSRVCPICAGLDGKTAPVGGMFPGGYDSPPAHSCCRCISLAWNPDWGEMRTATDARASARPEPEPEPIKPEDGPVAIENRAADHAPDGWRIGVGRIHEHVAEVPDVVPTQPAVVPREHVPESAYRAAAERAAAKLAQLAEAAEQRVAAEAVAAKPRGTTQVWRQTSVADEERIRLERIKQSGGSAGAGRRPGESWYEYDLRVARERRESTDRAIAKATAERERFVVPPGSVPFPVDRARNARDLPKARQVAPARRWWWPFGTPK